jgi:hypothetical protein
MGLNELLEKAISPRPVQHVWHSIDGTSISQIFRGGWTKILLYFGIILFQIIQRYLSSLDSLVSLGLFSGVAVALIAHKIILIALHSPLSTWGLMLVWPCLFEFDLLTLILFHWGLSSRKKLVKWGTSVASVFLMLLKQMRRSSGSAPWG